MESRSDIFNNSRLGGEFVVATKKDNEYETSIIENVSVDSKADLTELKDKSEKSNSPDEETYQGGIVETINNTPDSGLSKKEIIKKQAIHRVAVLLKELIGNRSIRRTAEDSGVAASYITGILKERYLPSADILRKLTSSDAKPQNAITMEDLMVAAGYQNDYVEEALKTTVYDSTRDEDNGKAIENKTNRDVLSRSTEYIEYSSNYKKIRDTYKLSVQELAMYRSLATGIIYNTLAENDIHFSNANNVIGVRGFKPDMSIYVQREPILEWWFEFEPYCPGIVEPRVIDLRNHIGQFMFIEPKHERKISYVVNSRDAFDVICGYKDKLSYRGDLSVILIDEESLSIIREEYLAHYDPDKTDSEFYII